MTRRILIIDDIRSEQQIPGLDIPRFDPTNSEEPKDSVLIARTYTLGIRALQLMGPWEILYLDHDLGCPGLPQPARNGYDVIKFLEEHVHNCIRWKVEAKLVPKQMICISSNPAGKKNIEDGWKAIQSKLKEIIIPEFKGYEP